MATIHGNLVLMILLATAISTQQPIENAALLALVQAERDFARASVEHGLKQAFLQYLADSALVFRPHPVNAKHWYEKLEESPVVLNWHPIYADMAQSGDFGYTTGPWEMTDNGPQKRAPIHGHYFSVWKKQNDGEWKVVIDLGIQHPAPQQKLEEPWQTSAPTRKLKFTIEKEQALRREKEALLRTDRAFAEFAQAQGYERALLEYSTANARWYRPNQQPLLEKAALQQYYRDRRDTVAFTPSHGEVARSTDLGYTRGSYEFSGAHTAPEKGYYVRMWKKAGKDKWRLVLEVISPVSEGQ